MPFEVESRTEVRVRHSLVVRFAHWVGTLAFFALLVTGVEILLSHPRFYWGEAGNINMKPLLVLPVASSRATVPTGYGLLPDANGWSRYLHFEAAWVLVLLGLVYVAASVLNGHFRRDLLPARGQWSWQAVRAVFAGYLRRTPAGPSVADSYNVVQRLAYLSVVFVLLPLMVWTGLAMSPSVTSAFPFLATAMGGRQSARTIHFFVTDALVLFVLVHLAMVVHAGFWSRVIPMVTGRVVSGKEGADERILTS